MTHSAVTSITSTKKAWIGEWDSKFAGVWMDYALLLVSFRVPLSFRLVSTGTILITYHYECEPPNTQLYSPFQSRARDLVIARLTMHHGAVLGDANKKPVPKNSPVMHCQRRYYQASFAIPKWRIDLATPLIAKHRTATASYPGAIEMVSAQGAMGLAINLFARRIETPVYEAGTA